jgi:transposase InsO family protein
MRHELVGAGLKCGENRVARIMRENGIKAQIKRKRVITTNSKHGRPFVENRVNQQFSVDAPDKVYASDITCVRTQKGWLYLAVVMDLYSRKVIGWATSSRLVPWVAVKALYRACEDRSPKAGTIIHSDRGSQYACIEFELLASCYKLTRSMSSTGNCYDNAVLESFFHSLKSEWLSWHTFKDREEAARSIFEYIETFYNRDRRHSTLGYLSPIEYEKVREKSRRCKNVA